MTHADASTGCLACGGTSDAVPLLSFEYRGATHRICPQHLPILIHSPAALADRLPGADSFPQGHPPG